MYQFIHVDTYSESVSKKALSRRSKNNVNGKQKSGTKSLLNLRQVIAEAKRENGSFPHVQNPLIPIKIFGINLDEVENLAIKSKIGQVDSKGRKLRTDTPVLLAGVASYPREEFDDDKLKFKSWLDDSAIWLQKVYGSNLKNITLHLDEEHPHIHFYAISPNGRAKDIHHGYMAESLIKNKTDSNAKRLAYTDAMRKFQDQYYLDVTSKYGMLRLGANKLRKPRSVYQAEKANAKLLEGKIKEIDSIEKEVLSSAKLKSDTLLSSTKIQIDIMKSKAREDIKRMQEAALSWARNGLENLRKLTLAEERVIKLNDELENTKAELQYFVEENNELRGKLNILKSNYKS